MAMSPGTLAQDLCDAMEAVYYPGTPLPPDSQAELLKYYTVVSEVLVSFMQQNTVVLPTALVAPPSGGPVTGTGTVT